MPSPKERIGYIADIRQHSSKLHFTVMSIYTTTVSLKLGMSAPPCVIQIDQKMAREMNQIAFNLDAKKIAFIPVTIDFFLGLENLGMVLFT